jgi:hypothetical protein
VPEVAQVTDDHVVDLHDERGIPPKRRTVLLVVKRMCSPDEYFGYVKLSRSLNNAW